ncbi:hypothetical protein AJ79_04364 [Helicocarpus griseus UAMH5409]|uniref:SET domain-containing protein n=1 Tax=Helicocarpus griseus UAMH5409 TaxID=1447875 RepID=A0A2B7XUN3_9EURO|nr:hypothetical protein AJ79_04364 [Helicocarpus griseus UAMH5409]
MESDWRFMKTPKEEEDRRQEQAEIRAKALLRTLYRQINMAANVQVLRNISKRDGMPIPLPSRISRDEAINRQYARFTLESIDELVRSQGTPGKLESNSLPRWPKWLRNRPDRWQIGTKTTQIRLARVWKSLNRDTEMLAICALSTAFRGAVWRETPRVWKIFKRLLKDNFVSILAFAQTRRLDPKEIMQLIGVATYPIQVGGRNMETLHPHEVVVNLKCQHLRRPTFEGYSQKNVKDYIVSSEFIKPGRVDPTIRTPADGSCDICSSKETCDCVCPGFPALLLELIETSDGRGTGVRALDNFKQGTKLGAFLGEVVSQNCDDYDAVYSLGLESKNNRHNKRMRALISPRRYGNWARFVNHSCDPSVAFVRRTIGKRIYMMMEALRDIEAFEEITVDYGEDYWKNRPMRCLCGSRHCKDRNEVIEKRRPHPVPTISLDNPFHCWQLRPDSEDKDEVWAMWEDVWKSQHTHIRQ